VSLIKDEEPAAKQGVAESQSLPVYEELRRRLISGQMKPGETTSIRVLAAELGIGVMPVREALKNLWSHKALTGEAKKAYRVPELDQHQAANLFQIRAVLEGGAAESAVEHITMEDIASLRAYSHIMNAAWKANDPQTFLETNFAFHSLIYQRAGNEDLLALIEILFMRTGPMLAHAIVNVAQIEDWENEHLAIVDAIERRDAALTRRLVEEDAKWGMTLFRHRA
jgi:DNA-binding GntR family transcriptional regulator